jgi:hypothetical protein
MGRNVRRGRGRRNRPVMFWLGAGMGMLVSAAAVAIAAEFTYIRRQRLLATGMLDLSEETIVSDLSAAVHHGLETLSHAASELGHSFAEARRELIRLGLDPAVGGGSDAGFYYDDDEHHAARPAAGGSEYDDQWDDAAGRSDNA